MAVQFPRQVCFDSCYIPEADTPVLLTCTRRFSCHYQKQTLQCCWHVHDAFRAITRSRHSSVVDMYTTLLVPLPEANTPVLLTYSRRFSCHYQKQTLQGCWHVQDASCAITRSRHDSAVDLYTRFSCHYQKPTLQCCWHVHDASRAIIRSQHSSAVDMYTTLLVTLPEADTPVLLTYTRRFSCHYQKPILQCCWHVHDASRAITRSRHSSAVDIYATLLVPLPDADTPVLLTCTRRFSGHYQTPPTLHGALLTFTRRFRSNISSVLHLKLHQDKTNSHILYTFLSRILELYRITLARAGIIILNIIEMFPKRTMQI